MVSIIPAVLPKTFAELEEKAGIAESFTDTLHLDIADTTFTAFESWIPNQPTILPAGGALVYDVHIMSRNYLDIFQVLDPKNIRRVYVHVEVLEKRDALSDMRAHAPQVDIGCAIRVETDVRIAIKTARGYGVTHLLLMNICEIGKQGSAVAEKALARLSEAGSLWNAPIGVDGAVTLENITSFSKNGADEIVVGSAIWKSSDPASSTDDLRACVASDTI